jgi:glycosyltransferase involved in cell wall biosynthesis
MKILMIAPTPFFSDRGCHVRIFEETKVLQKHKHQVTICTYHNGEDIPGITTSRITNIPWYKKSEAGPSFHKIYLDIILLFHTLKIAKKMKPDIIHAHLHEGCLIGYFIKKMIRKPLIFDYQGSLSDEMMSHGYFTNSKMIYKIIQVFEKKINNSADLIVTSSQKMAQNLQENGKIPKNKIFFTLDGVDTDIFIPDNTTEILREKLQLPKNKKIIVYLGLLNEYQGIDCLLKSIVSILKHRTDIHFLIMGFPNQARYENIAKQLKINDHVTFTGRISYFEAPRYLALGDLAVSPKLSITEAKGKLYNYMACGLPTVVFDSPTNREILGDLGIYAKIFGNPESFAEAIEFGLNNENILRVLGQKLREKAVTDFSWDAVVEKILNVYTISEKGFL